VALITGGDSGIGRSVAILFAREGANVAITYLSEDADADETRKHIEREGRRCLTIAGDVKDRAFCRQAVARVVKQLGALNALVNNAAFLVHAPSLADLSERHFAPVWTPLNPSDKQGKDVRNFGKDTPMKRPA